MTSTAPLQLLPTEAAPATHRLHSVTLTMADLDADKQVERTIDASNVRVADATAALDFEGDVLGTVEQQRRLLNEWIWTRGNEQHDTLLSLEGWKLNYYPIAA